MQPLYNREGRAIAYIADNGISLYFYDGEAAGWVYQDSLVFAYSGKFLGWLMYGWLCDPGGNPAFFTDRSSGGPKRPARQPRPIRASRDSRPTRRQRQERPSRPGMTLTWSARSDESFFVVAPGEAVGPLEEAAPSSEPGAAAAGSESSASGAGSPSSDHVSPSESSDSPAESAESATDASPPESGSGDAAPVAPAEPEATAAGPPAILGPGEDKTA